VRRLPAFGDLGERISDVAGLDVVVRAGVRAGTRALPSRSRDALHGVPLGEPLHPVLTDVTIGAWTSSFLLDIFGGRAGRPAARQLVALGVLSAVPTIASGAADWLEIDAETQRVGAVHAMTNVVATLLYGWSWAARRRGHHARGVRLGLAGAAVATIGGGLGGYLVFRRATGVNRSLGDEGPNDWTTIDSATPSGSLGVVQCDGAQVLVYLDAGQLDAIGDTCSHQGAPLHEGEVFDGCVRCPWHGSEFRLRDGSVTTGPATAPQPRYEARVDGPGYQLRRVRHARVAR
jgi:Ferredoxin subunits of nitrite reductase and ring-hydroxylating dioxygenases